MVKLIFVSLLISFNLSAQSEILVDPTAPLNFKPKKQIQTHRAILPTLQSIVVKAHKHQAIINNKIYQKGQYINGYQIILIDMDKVLLEYQKKTYKLTLYSPSESFSH